MIGPALLVCIALVTPGAPGSQDGRDALGRSDFLGALEASGKSMNPLDGARLRMDTLYAAGDLVGALDAARHVMDLDSRGPHGAYMTSRLALDLGLESAGRDALAAFEERLRMASQAMAPGTLQWYEGKGEELKGQLERLVDQGEAEHMAMGRARGAVAGLAFFVLLVTWFLGRRPSAR